MNITFGITDFFRISPLIAVVLASIIPITIKVLRGNREQAPEATLIQGLGGLIATGLLMLTVYLLIGGSQEPTAFSNMIVFDGVTLWIGLTAILAAIVSLILMYENPSTSGEQFSELTFLTLSSVFGMLILVSAVDLIIVFIGLETMSLALYLMIAMSHEQKLSKEASFKYFILGSFTSAIFLYGVSFLFGTTGGTYIPDIVTQTAELISTSRLFIIGIALVIIGFCFKVSIAPFHAWTPDVYQGAPTPHTALMSTAVKAVSFAAFIRIITTQSLVGSESLFQLLQWLAVITMIVGNVAALLQTKLKRVFAYSSIAHSGYLLVGIITIGISDRISMGTSGVIFYLIAYTLMTLGGFALVSLLEKTEDTEITMDSLSGLGKRNPAMAFCLTIFLLSLAGIPPTVGFFGKFYIFTSAISEGLLWLALWGVINSVIAVYYYLKPVIYMYMKEAEQEPVLLNMNLTKTAILTLAFFVVFIGIFSGRVFTIIEQAML